MKLTTLTLEQKELLKKNKEKYINKFLNNEKINKDIATNIITFYYSFIKKSCPKIYQVISPYDAQILANQLNNTKNKFYSFGTYLTIGWASFYAYYDTFVELGIITIDKFPKYFELRKSIESNIFLTVEFENAIIICEKPEKINKFNGKLHNTKEKAIEWSNGYGQYYVNGRCVNKNIFEKVNNNLFTFDEFQKLTDEDVKASIITIIKENKGNKAVIEFLNAELIDEQTIKHSDTYSEIQRLYRTKNTFSWANDSKGNTNVKLAWNEMICPSTGSSYLIETCPTFNDVVESAKWLRPKNVPTDLIYQWNSAN